MPFYDRECPNGHKMIDCWEAIEPPEVKCATCGQTTKRAWYAKTGNVIGDDIPGGVEIRHGLCNPDGSPRKYYSKTEIAAEAKRRGLVNIVEHVGDGRGSDKSKHTTRWVSISPISEEERVKFWHEAEEKLQKELQGKIVVKIDGIEET